MFNNVLSTDFKSASESSFQFLDQVNKGCPKKTGELCFNFLGVLIVIRYTKKNKLEILVISSDNTDQLF